MVKVMVKEDQILTYKDVNYTGGQSVEIPDSMLEKYKDKIIPPKQVKKAEPAKIAEVKKPILKPQYFKEAKKKDLKKEITPQQEEN